MSCLPLSISVPLKSLPIVQEAWAPPATLLEAISGDEGLMAEFIDIFELDTETRIGQLGRALAASDIRSIGAEAHSIKGSARQLGANALADACQELEFASTRARALHIAGLVKRVELLFKETRHAMASYSNDSATTDSAASHRGPVGSTISGLPATVRPL